MRPGAGNFRLTRTPEEYARGVDFKRVLATGWHRSMWDSYDVVQHGPAKAHVAGHYSRYTEDGERIRRLAVSCPPSCLQLKYDVYRPGGQWTFASAAAVAGAAAAYFPLLQLAHCVGVFLYFPAWQWQHRPQ